MSLQIRKAAPSGLSVYAVLRRSGDEFRWIVGNGFEAFNAANLDSYDVPLTDSGGDDYATDLAFTAGAGRYIAAFYVRAGSAPANDDFKLPGEEVYDWTGTGLSGDVHYATIADVKLELGQANADLWADLENTLSGVDISAVQDDALTEADDWIDGELREAGVAVPVVSNGDDAAYASSMRQVKRAARKYTAGTLLNRKEGQSRDGDKKTSGDVLIEKAEEIMEELIESGASGFTTATVGDLDLNDIGMVTAGASITPDGLPKPPRCSYGYYDRLYGGWVYR